MTVAYDGRAYFGWQRRQDTPTLQGAIEKALAATFGDVGPAQGAGRTDRGVHAEGQVVSVRLPAHVGDDGLAALNDALPDDIRVLTLDPAPDGFHARTSATGKRYRYEIVVGHCVPELDGRVWHARRALDVTAMQAAAAALVGEHDFATFASPTRSKKQGGKAQQRSTRRHLRRFDVTGDGHQITLVLEADSFLYKMVRNLVHAVARVGEGRATVEELRAALAARDRSAATGTAPASGLYLDEVFYASPSPSPSPSPSDDRPVPTEVRWDRLKPRELAARLAVRNIAWWPLGTLEWHGHHLPLGVDALISEALMRRCAARFGGVVLPPLHLGPDRSEVRGGEQLIGMDIDEATTPAQKLPGNAYWVSEALFDEIVDAQLAQLKRAGIEAVFADGHGPSRWRWGATLLARAAKSGLRVYGVDKAAEAAWPSQTDHAARNETSMMLAAYPDLVDLAALDGEDGRLGVAGADPAEATAEEGERCFGEAVAQVGAMLGVALGGGD
jgi:tRNA pseudouridine38-40 synthase